MARVVCSFVDFLFLHFCFFINHHIISKLEDERVNTQHINPYTDKQNILQNCPPKKSISRYTLARSCAYKYHRDDRSPISVCSGSIQREREMHFCAFLLVWQWLYGMDIINTCMELYIYISFTVVCTRTNLINKYSICLNIFYSNDVKILLYIRI
jgi:hypothetical protein